MSSSKILRGLGAHECSPFEFSSFDNPESLAAGVNHSLGIVSLDEGKGSAPQTSSSHSTKMDSDPNEIEKAFLMGKEEGLQEGAQNLDTAIQALGQALEDVSQLRKSIIHNSSQDMLHLVLTISRQVLHCEVSVKPETILSSIERALLASISTDSYHVKVNSQDIELVKEKKPFFLARVTGLKNITFEADETISRGSCKVESELGEVDASIETQLDEIRQYLLASITG